MSQMDRSTRWCIGWVVATGTMLLVLTGCGTGKAGSESVSATLPGNSSAVESATGLSAAVAAVNTPDATAAPFIGATPGSGKGMIVGYISAGESSPFVHSLTLGMQEQAAKAGMTLKFCDAQFDPTKALQCAKNLSTLGIRALFDMQTDNKASPAICAINGSLPTIALAIHQKPCEKSFVGIDDEHAGQVAGVAMGTYVKTRFDCKIDKILSLEQVSAGTTNQARVAGWTQGYQSICGKGDAIEHLDTGGVIDQAQKVVTDALTGAPGAKRIVVFAIDDDAARGAVAAASTAGRSNALFVASQGGDESAHCEVRKDSQWVADVGYFPERYGEIAVPAMVDTLSGKTVKSNLDAQLAAFNGSNIQKFYPNDHC